MDIQSLYDRYLQHPQIATDTRKIAPGSIFFALKGERFNGNQFAAQALAAGAAYAVVDEPQGVVSDRCVLVDDVLSTLQLLANIHRRRFSIPLIAVTGSNGKTTTKELLVRVLARKYKVHYTQGNLNNHIGVPLTLLSMPLDTEVCVLEMGDNHVGEVTELCRIAEPTCGFITNIGMDHIEGFGSFEANVRAKSEVFDYLLRTQGTIFYNSKDEILRNMAARFAQPVAYGSPGDYACLTFLGASPYIRYRTEEGAAVDTHLIGSYNFENIQTAYCLGKYFGVPAQQAHEALAAYAPENNRSQLLLQGSNLIVLDAYNANPSSVEAALHNFAQFETDKQKVVVLGDMFELGSISAREHGRMVELAAALQLQAYFCGSRYAEWSELPGSFFTQKEALAEHLRQHPLSDSLVLLKGSRSMGLETLLEVL